MLPAWKARQVAKETIPLVAAAADYVDRQLAPFAHHLSFGRITAAVQAAVLRHDPDLAAERARRAAERRGVWVEDSVPSSTTAAVAREEATTSIARASPASGASPLSDRSAPPSVIIWGWLSRWFPSDPSGLTSSRVEAVLRRALGDVDSAVIEHVGSTSVPGLAA